MNRESGLWVKAGQGQGWVQGLLLSWPLITPIPAVCVAGVFWV